MPCGRLDSEVSGCEPRSLQASVNRRLVHVDIRRQAEVNIRPQALRMLFWEISGRAPLPYTLHVISADATNARDKFGVTGEVPGQGAAS